MVDAHDIFAHKNGLIAERATWAGRRLFGLGLAPEFMNTPHSDQ